MHCKSTSRKLGISVLILCRVKFKTRYMTNIEDDISEPWGADSLYTALLSSMHLIILSKNGD